VSNAHLKNGDMGGRGGYGNGWRRPPTENDIEIYKFLSPKFAVRGALGNLGMGHLLQNLEDDLIRWVGEAYDYIIKDTKAETIYRPVEQVAFTKNSRVKLCDEFVAMECLTLNGCRINYLYSRDRCRGCATTMENSCGCGIIAVGNPPPYNCTQFTVEGCFVKFWPQNLPDGLKVEIKAWGIPKDEDGYVLVIDQTIAAIQDYVAYKVCHRLGDRREATNRQDWYYHCKIARAAINKKTDSEMQAISQYWAPRSFYSGVNYRGNNGAYAH